MNDIEEEHGYTDGTYVAVYRPRRTSEAENGREDSTPARLRGTVVIVPSVGDEHRSLIRTEVELARRFAGEGLLAVRFDFSGDGASPRRRSMENFMSDITAAWSLTEGPVTAVAFRVGLYLLGRFLSRRSPEAPFSIFAIGPVSGAEFMREAQRRASIRNMMTVGTAQGSDDLAGDVYPPALVEALAEPLHPEGLSGRILALEIGPQKSAKKDAQDIVGAFIAAGLSPSEPQKAENARLRLAPEFTESGTEGIIIWRHSVLWGEVEHSDVRPLYKAVFDFLDQDAGLRAGKR